MAVCERLGRDLDEMIDDHTAFTEGMVSEAEWAILDKTKLNNSRIKAD